MLYLVKTNEFYKIGFTDNLEKRMSNYTTYNPVIELLGIKEGTKNDETAYHLSFCNYDGTGEWYKIPEEIINEIRKDFVPCDILKRPNKKFISKTEEYKDLNRKRDRRQYYKERAQRPERKEYMRQYQKTYREKWTEEQKQKMKDYQKKYREEHKKKN